MLSQRGSIVSAERMGGEADFSSMSYKNVVLLILKGPWVHHSPMTRPMDPLEQDRLRTRGRRTHHPDDREGATLLLVLLTAAALTVLTTPALAGLVMLLSVTALLA